MAEADVLRVILSLVAVILLLLGAAWLTRRAGLLRTGNTRAIQVLGMQNLGGRGYLALVQVEDTRLLLGITATQINLLHTLDDSVAAKEHGGRKDGVRARALTPEASDSDVSEADFGARALTSGASGFDAVEGGVRADAQTPGAPSTEAAEESVRAGASTPVSPSHRFAQVLGKALKGR